MQTLIMTIVDYNDNYNVNVDYDYGYNHNDYSNTNANRNYVYNNLRNNLECGYVTTEAFP